MNSAGLGAFRYLGVGSYWGTQGFRPTLDAAFSLCRAAEPPAGLAVPTARAQPPDSRRPFLLPAATAPITVDLLTEWGVRPSSLAGCLALPRIRTARPTLRANALRPPIEHGWKSVPWSASHPCPSTPKSVSPMTLRAHVARQPGVERGRIRISSRLAGGRSGRAHHALRVCSPAAETRRCAQPRGTEKGSPSGTAPRRAFRPSLPRTQMAFPL